MCVCVHVCVRVSTCRVCESVTHHAGHVDGAQQVPRVEGEEDGDHGAEDEVEEGDAHRRLAAPVGRRHQARDTQGGATLDLHGGRESEGLNDNDKTTKELKLGSAIWRNQPEVARL